MKLPFEVMQARSKIKTAQELCKICNDGRKRKRRIVFTNGCFDLLHLGHLRYLEAAREKGDVLIVAVNSDASVQSIKGPDRPIVTQDERSEMVAALHCVDYVVLFETPDPLPLIELLAPDILVKGADWPIEEMIGADIVRNKGGDVVRIPLVSGVSTSLLIKRILHRYGNH